MSQLNTGWAVWKFEPGKIGYCTCMERPVPADTAAAEAAFDASHQFHSAAIGVQF